MAILSLPAVWVSDVNVPISAADLDEFRDVCMQLDGLSFRPMNVTNSSGPQFNGDAADWHSGGDYRQSWWGLRFTTGMTTLTIIGACATQIDIYLGGVLNSSQAASASFTRNITLTGYADGAIILIEIRTNGNPLPSHGSTAAYTGKYIIWEMYGSPVVTTSAWPGVPTFAGTYSAALLNQLRDAAQYVWDRVAAIPILPNLAHIYDETTHKAETSKVFHGGAGRYTSSDVLAIGGTIFPRNAAEHYEIYIGGALALTSATFAAGQVTTFTHLLALSHTLGTRAEVEIRVVVTSSPNNPPENFSQIGLHTMRTDATYPSATPPGVLVADAFASQATRDGYLNGLATMLSTAKARLDARPEQWNRAQACRRVYANDATQVARNYRRHCAVFRRQGDVLLVRGKDIKIGYGVFSLDDPGETDGTPNPVNYTKFHFANEVSVGKNADKIETNVVPLDGLPGLKKDMMYYVWGAPGSGSYEYAAEFLSDAP
jgi:hypothetical protein